MTGVVGLSGVWLCTGVMGAPLLRRFRHRRAASALPLLVAAAAAFTVSQAGWPGPTGGGSSGLVLGREGVGLMLVSALALAATLVLSPAVSGGEMLPAAVVGAASAIILSATSPIVWAAAVAVGVGGLVVRWIAVAPGRPSLAAGQVAGMGAAALVAAAPFVVAAGMDAAPRSILAGALIAVGVAAVLGVVPFGGWAAGCLATVRGLEFAPWALLLAPAVLLSTGAAARGLSASTLGAFSRVVLIAGLGGAAWGGLVALTGGVVDRYGRVLLADLALALAALGTGQPGMARSAALLLVLVHLCAAPLLLHRDHRRLTRPRALSWFAVSGVPPSPAFWARFLVLEACAAAGVAALIAALAATAMILIVSVIALTQRRHALLSPVPWPVRWVAWTLALGSIGLGLVPQAVVLVVFGSA